MLLARACVRLARGGQIRHRKSFTKKEGTFLAQRERGTYSIYGFSADGRGRLPMEYVGKCLTRTIFPNAQCNGNAVRQSRAPRSVGRFCRHAIRLRIHARSLTILWLKQPMVGRLYSLGPSYPAKSGRAMILNQPCATAWLA